jgi:hypothetical protein
MCNSSWPTVGTFARNFTESTIINHENTAQKHNISKFQLITSLFNSHGLVVKPSC